MSPETAHLATERDKAIAELVSWSQHHDQQFAAAVTPIDAAQISKALTWPIGTRVLDLVTGAKGVVIDGKRENVVLPTT